ncbi:class I SAM-dependent methyltransferase [Geodermatophilus sp. SYSU D01106]
MPPRSLWPSADGLAYESADVAGRVLDVLLDDRRVWSFRDRPDGVAPERPPGVDEGTRVGFEPWPPALLPHLRGTFRVALRTVGEDAGAWAEAETSLDGDPGPLRLADRHGRPLVVNKWGRLGHALGDAGPAMVERMLDSMDEIRALVQAHLGDRVYVTGGSLLGPVREDGHVLPHDDDADLAYLSRLSVPVDVVLEAFELGRVLAGAGHRVLRLSAGHLQVLVEHEGRPDHYVDVFTGFLLEGRWFQHFPIRTEATEEDLLPPVTVLVEGRPEPAPRDPERMLVELFGPGWRVPDPAYQFDIPPETADRFYGWFADYNVEREGWEDEVVLATGEPRPARAMSGLARALHATAPDGAPVLDLGCGLGSDALALAAAGRTVRAVDFSRYALETARRAAGERDLDVAFDVLNLLDTRLVLRLGAELAAGHPGAWTVLGRRLLNALEDRGRDNVFRLCGMLLRRGGTAHLDVVADHAHPGIAPHRHLRLDDVLAEAARHRLVADEVVPCTEPVSWAGAPEERLTDLWRITLRRRNS